MADIFETTELTPAMLTKVRERAAELVLQGHARGVTARDEHGSRCSPYASCAVQWCVMGALARAIFDVTGNRSLTATAVFDVHWMAAGAVVNDDIGTPEWAAAWLRAGA